MKETCLSFEGRIGRLQYLALSTLLPFAIVVAGFLLAAVAASIAGDLGLILIPLYVVGYILVVWMSLAAGVRRLHDLGHSGWWLLLFLVPLVSLVLALLLYLWPGEEGANDYGPRA